MKHSQGSSFLPDCTYNIISRVSDVSIKNESGYQEITKKRRLNSISSDSDQSEDYIKG